MGVVMLVSSATNLLLFYGLLFDVHLYFSLFTLALVFFFSCVNLFLWMPARTDEELLQTAVMMTAAGGGPPLAAMLTDLPPHFCTRQLGVTMMQGSSATLGRGGKTRWVSRFNVWHSITYVPDGKLVFQCHLGGVYWFLWRLFFPLFGIWSERWTGRLHQPVFGSRFVDATPTAARSLDEF